jgi:multidrug efflux pump subunit AcrA (membrane-fusion protein)
VFEDEIKKDLHAKRVSLARAQIDHDQQRSLYHTEFRRYASQQTHRRNVDLAAKFAPIHIRRGQSVIKALRNAEAAVEEAERAATKADISLIPGVAEDAANIYLDDYELDAMCAGKNARCTFCWRDVQGGMEDPVVCPTIATEEGTASDTEI